MTADSGKDASSISCTIAVCPCGSGKHRQIGRQALVCWQGAQRDVLHGDIRGVVDVSRLARLENLYGIGPLEDVKGEVTLLDSRPYIARIGADGTLTVENSFDHWACFLVYCQVPRWLKVELPEQVRNERSLEALLPELAAWHGIDPLRPFPFLLRGRPELADFHVLNKTDDLPHSAEEHDKAKVRFSLAQTEMEAIGFYSRNHRGIFTPSDSCLHIHLTSADGAVSGHVESLSFPQGLELFLPLG